MGEPDERGTRSGRLPALLASVFDAGALLMSGYGVYQNGKASTRLAAIEAEVQRMKTRADETHSRVEGIRQEGERRRAELFRRFAERGNRAEVQNTFREV